MKSLFYTNPPDTRINNSGRPPAPFAWPAGKTFAFTIFDDTDGSTVENISPIYRLLRDLGFRTTKSVWLQRCTTSARTPAETCADTAYLAFVLELQQAGFEIAFHNASWDTSTRSDILVALAHFQQIFGAPPQSFAQHGDCNENIYWADARVSGLRRVLYRACRYHADYHPEGHLPESPYFWGDFCRRNIKYVRNFVFRDINTLKVCPEMPYHDPLRPYVNYWFASSDGCEPEGFIRLLSPDNQDRLEREGGACIVYTHLYNFSRNGEVLPEVKQALQRLATKNGWFVPVSTLLDFLLARRAEAPLTEGQRRRLEWNWLRDATLAHAADFLHRRFPRCTAEGPLSEFAT